MRSRSEPTCTTLTLTVNVNKFETTEVQVLSNVRVNAIQNRIEEEHCSLTSNTDCPFVLIFHKIYKNDTETLFV